ncbi:tyrosine-type recombinase/integrase [Streptomyces sp. NPDC055681]
MTLAVVRNLSSPRALRTGQDLEDFEQEIVDQYALAMAAAGLTDGYVGDVRASVIEFVRSLPGPLWTASCEDGDRFLTEQRRAGRANGTLASKAGHLAQFYDFVISRYQGDLHALTGSVVVQPIDEFNRPCRVVGGQLRVPPVETEIELLFGQWGPRIVEARKYLPAARDYFAASLWRRLGLRISETVMLDLRDWRPDLGEHGKLHVRFGKGSRGRGPKSRLVPAINDADRLIDWWLGDVRHRFGSDWADPDAPMLPSERHDPDLNRCRRVRGGLAQRLGRPGEALAPGLGGTADPACAAALLRVLPVRPRNGPQGPPGTPWSRMAVHDEPLYPRPRRAHRTGLGAGQPTGGIPTPGRDVMS